MTTTTNANSATDLIESKFNLLAGKILDELRQAEYSREFFQALDSILNDQHRHEAKQPKRSALERSPSKHQQERSATATTAAKDTSEIYGSDFDKLKRQCELITEKQKQQQEQLNNHQQILFDSQYRSLPAEITDAVASHEQRRANARLQAQAQSSDISSQIASSNKQEPVNRRTPTTAAQMTTSARSGTRTSGVKTSASRENLDAAGKRESPTLNQKQRSAIPQSTILSGINQKVDSPAYPISKSATVGANGELDNSSPALKRQSSLRLNRDTQKESAQQQQQQQQQQTRPLAASEKLRQRRPTKATLLDQRAVASDDSDLEDDDDDDDDDDGEFQYQNLASHRAYLNQRFINQQQEQPTKTSGGGGGGGESATQAARQQDAGRQRQVQSTVQSGLKQAPTSNPSNMTVARQRQRFSSGAQVVRSSTMATSRPSAAAAARQQVKPARAKEVEQAAIEHEQPRSFGGLLTSHDIGQLYKPHMNYSTSLLGNHRLSDDDEIIIIPTCQSPSLMSASVSPVPNRGQSHQQAAAATSAADGQQLSDQGNMDESSERFSISRTKSFWEKLANSKSGGGGGELESTRCTNASSPQQTAAAADQKNHFNSSQRSLSSGPNLVVDQSKSSQCSLHNQSGASHNTSNKSTTSDCHYPAAMKSAFDRMDSTGGSGNSHYSGASTSSGGSTSGDEQTLSSSNAGHVSLAERRAMLISAANAKTDFVSQKQRSGPNASINPAINQLVKQDLINRSDKFRQTR